METLTLDQDGPLAVVTINRPDKLNALNARTLEELSETFEALSVDDGVRAIILTGAGPKAFVAGADIAEFTDMNPVEARAASERGQAVMDRIENCGKLVIAAVNGFALGGGLELALAAHIRLGSETARFGLPEVKLGLIPGYGGTQRLAREIGPGRAARMIATADMIDAPTALNWGLLCEVCPPESLLERAREIGATVSGMAPLAVSTALACLRSGLNHDGMKVEAEGFGSCFSTDDMKEGVAAFLEKRPAVFKGA